MDGISPLFPYLLIYRIEEAEGSNPALSVRKAAVSYQPSAYKNLIRA
jgi:hypothetical protein